MGTSWTFNSSFEHPIVTIKFRPAFASAVIPTFIAPKWFLPVHSEDLLEPDEAGDQ